VTAIHIGTSGWSYPEWKGHFYPAELRRSFQQCGGEQHLLPASPAISSGGMD
jgi:hypothetical protein